MLYVLGIHLPDDPPAVQKFVHHFHNDFLRKRNLIRKLGLVVLCRDVFLEIT